MPRMLRRYALRWNAFVFLCAAMVVAGCGLDRGGTGPYAWDYAVKPANVCPGDSVTVSWNTREVRPGCLVSCGLFGCSDCPDPMQVGVSSSPAVLPSLTTFEQSGSVGAGPITVDTTFSFTLQDNDEDLGTFERTVHVVLPERETTVPLAFEGACSGTSAAWEPVSLAVPDFRSEGVRLLRVCNTSPQTVSFYVTFEGGSTSDSLLPGRCTPDFPETIGRKVLSASARIAFTGPVSCDTSSSLPPDIGLNALLTCDVRTAMDAIVAAPPKSSPVPDILQIATLTASPIAATPTDQPPSAIFLQTGNCRSGPGGIYNVVTSYPQGTQVTLEGRNSDSTWWWVLMLEVGGHCFASGSVLDLKGSTDSLPIIAAPPTPTSAPSPTVSVQPPAAPNKVAISSRVCDSKSYSVVVGWNDTATNESGYRVYRDGNLIATLGANATGYTDAPPYGGPYTYGVEAFNAAGASSRPTVVESGCIY